MTLLADLKFGVRMLLKSPAFTLAAVSAIGLGIGVNSMMFTIYNAALFKSVGNSRAVRHSTRIVAGGNPGSLAPAIAPLHTRSPRPGSAP